MRALNEIEAWDDETLRANQDCRSEHDQWIISLVRKKKTFDKDREAREVREAVAVAARAQRLAATAPARAAQARARLERKNADRARAPPATRSLEERKKQRETLRERMQFLGELGGKRPPPPTQPPGVNPPPFSTRAAAAAAAAAAAQEEEEEEEEEEEAATPRHAVQPPAAEQRDSESESESESEGAWQAEDLAAMGIVAGTCLPCSFPSFREFCALRELHGGAFEEIAARIAADEEEEEEAS